MVETTHRETARGKVGDSLTGLRGRVGLRLSTEPVLKVAQHHYLSHLHPNDGTGSNTHTHTRGTDSSLCSK